MTLDQSPNRRSTVVPSRWVGGPSKTILTPFCARDPFLCRQNELAAELGAAQGVRQ